MRKSVVLVGTLDTKGDQLVYLKEQIERHGQRVVVIDMGVLGEPALPPTVDKHQVAAAAGTTIQELIALNGPALAMSKMAEGVAKVMKACGTRANSTESWVWAVPWVLLLHWLRLRVSPWGCRSCS